MCCWAGNWHHPENANVLLLQIELGVTVDTVLNCSPANCAKPNALHAVAARDWLQFDSHLYNTFFPFLRHYFSVLAQRHHSIGEHMALLLSGEGDQWLPCWPAPHPWIPELCCWTARVAAGKFVLLWQVLAFGSIPSKQTVTETWRLGSKSESQPYG